MSTVQMVITWYTIQRLLVLHYPSQQVSQFIGLVFTRWGSTTSSKSLSSGLCIPFFQI